MRALRLLPLTLGTLLLIGCASKTLQVQGYEGAARPADAVATVTVPVQLEVFEVSGLAVDPPSLDRGEYTLAVPAGRQQLLVQYFESWTGTSGEEVVRSPSMALVAHFEAGQRYRLEYPAPPILEAARRYAREPVVTLVKADGSHPVAATVRPHSEQGLLGRAPSNFRPAPARAQAEDPPQATGGEPLEQLKHWWEQASEAERQAFWQWMGTKLVR